MWFDHVEGISEQGHWRLQGLAWHPWLAFLKVINSPCDTNSKQLTYSPTDTHTTGASIINAFDPGSRGNCWVAYSEGQCWGIMLIIMHHHLMLQWSRRWRRQVSGIWNESILCSRWNAMTTFTICYRVWVSMTYLYILHGFLLSICTAKGSTQTEPSH